MSVLASPADRKAMKAMIVEMTNCLERIDGETEQMKDIGEAAEEKFSIKRTEERRVGKECRPGVAGNDRTESDEQLKD